MAQTTGETGSQQSGGEEVESRPQTPTATPDKPPVFPPSRQSTEVPVPSASSPPCSPTSSQEEAHTFKTISIPSGHLRPHHPRNQSTASSKEQHDAARASPPGSERDSEHGSTTEEDDEDSETEPEEDIEEVRPCLPLDSLVTEPDIRPAGGEKNGTMRWCRESFPAHITLLFGLPIADM
jgi:hypothetical protein